MKAIYVNINIMICLCHQNTTLHVLSSFIVDLSLIAVIIMFIKGPQKEEGVYAKSKK